MNEGENIQPTQYQENEDNQSIFLSSCINPDICFESKHHTTCKGIDEHPKNSIFAHSSLPHLRHKTKKELETKETE